MKEPLRAAINEAAHQRGVSMNAEVIARLERSFAEEAHVGGPTMLGVTNLMSGAFLRGGQAAATASGHPEWTVDQWLQDDFCRRAASLAVGQALSLPLPDRAAMDDPRGVYDLFAGMVARGAPIRKSTQEEEK
jgi:hypothetical protein